MKHDEIDTKKWDHCIDRAVNGMIYAYSWYLDLVNDNWEALVENDYERVMPLTNGRKFGIRYLYQPFFTQQLGIFSRAQLSHDVVAGFLQAIPRKYCFAEINLNTHNKIEKPDARFSPWLTHELDLIGDYESIAAGYSKNLKRNLKKAQEGYVNIVENIKPDNVIRIFRENKGRGLKHLKDHNYDLLRRLIYVMIYKRTARVVGAYNEVNELCAGAFFVYSGRKVIFYFSATDSTAKEYAAMPYLIDDFIRRHAGSHLTLDFEGSNDENLARFYKSFGAREVHYLHYKMNRLNPLINAGVKSIKQIRQRLR